MTKKHSNKNKQDDDQNDRLYLHCYALHPPDKDYPVDGLKDLRAYYTEPELLAEKGNDVLHLSTKHPSFVKSGNPIHAIEAVLLAHENGLYPPIWALDFIYKAFLEYHNNQGQTSMDKCLDLTRGRGQCSAFNEVHNHDRDETIMLHVGRLQILFGYTVDEACSMVARMLEELPEEKVKYVKILSFETIRDRYYAKWKDIVGPDNKHIVEALMKWSEEKKIEYLTRYPDDSIPLRLANPKCKRKPDRRKK